MAKEITIQTSVRVAATNRSIVVVGNFRADQLFPDNVQREQLIDTSVTEVDLTGALIPRYLFIKNPDPDYSVRVGAGYPTPQYLIQLNPGESTLLPLIDLPTGTIGAIADGAPVTVELTIIGENTEGS